MALKMIEDAEADGRLNLAEPFCRRNLCYHRNGSGSYCYRQGYKLICVSTDKQSKEKFDVLRAVGAEAIVCPTDVAPDDPRSYYSTEKNWCKPQMPGMSINMTIHQIH